MRRKSSVLIAVLAAVLLLTASGLAGCTAKVSDFTVILGKNVFEVDESFEETASKLYVVYRGGAAGYVNLKSSMVSGFDTALSGDFTLTVNYGGVKKTAAYTVSGETKTRARLALGGGAGAECVVSLKNADFPIYAISFTLTGNSLPESLESKVGGWKMKQTAGVGGNSRSVILYTDNRNPISENTVIFNFFSAIGDEISATGIFVASEDKEWRLPDAKLKIG